MRFAPKQEEEAAHREMSLGYMSCGVRTRREVVLMRKAWICLSWVIVLHDFSLSMTHNSWEFMSWA